MGPVSPEVSRMLAIRALSVTPEADLAVAVTRGDPGASSKTDGKLFCACQFRNSGLIELGCVLNSPEPADAHDIAARTKRLEGATDCVLRFTIDSIKKNQATRGTGTQ